MGEDWYLAESSFISFMNHAEASAHDSHAVNQFPLIKKQGCYLMESWDSRAVCTECIKIDLDIRELVR